MTALSGGWATYYCCCASPVSAPLGTPCQLLQPLLCVLFSVLPLHVPAVGQEQTTECCAPCHTLAQRAAVHSPDHWLVWFACAGAKLSRTRACVKQVRFGDWNSAACEPQPWLQGHGCLGLHGCGLHAAAYCHLDGRVAVQIIHTDTLICELHSAYTLPTMCGSWPPAATCDSAWLTDV